MKMIRLTFLCLLLAALTACAGHQPHSGKSRLIRLDNNIVEDSKTGLQWQYDKSPHRFDNQKDAAAYAAGLDLGDHHDWRLPTLGERWDLLQVFAIYKNNGGIEFPHFDSKYWTTDTSEGAQPIKLSVTCMCRGDQVVEYKQNGYVRAVRGGKTGE